ncbi:hypothetical protein V8C86DRAFT_2646413, partial [Haematococcus lacustris]
RPDSRLFWYSLFLGFSAVGAVGGNHPWPAVRLRLRLRLRLFWRATARTARMSINVGVGVGWRTKMLMRTQPSLSSNREGRPAEG